jgi:subtilisin family serine protease
MASPLVSGVVSLISAANPALSMLQVRSILLSNARPLDSLQGYVITGALVDAQAAVAAAKVTAALPRVAGYVRNGARGVADATVTVEQRGVDGVIRTTTTGGDGSFSFSQLPLGTYILRAKKIRLKFSPATVRATSARRLKCDFLVR